MLRLGDKRTIEVEFIEGDCNDRGCRQFYFKFGTGYRPMKVDCFELARNLDEEVCTDGPRLDPRTLYHKGT